MEVKSKTKVSEGNRQDKTTSFEALVESSDLVKEMYFSLKKQKTKLTPEQILWMNKVEDTFSTAKLTEADIVCTLLQNTYDYLNKTKKWSDEDKYAYEMFEKIVFLKSKDGIFHEFVDNAEAAIRSTLSLDFSKKATLCSEKLDQRNILNYITFALNMVIEKIETSMVSMKVINVMLAAPPQSAFIVTDKTGSIRFINQIGESLFGIQHNEYLHKTIHSLFKIDDQLLQNCLEQSCNLTDVKIELLIDENKIPVLLSSIEVNTEEDEITEIVFLIKTRQQAEKEIKHKQYIKSGTIDESNSMDSISEMLHLLRSQSKDIDSTHLITYLEEGLDIIKKDKLQSAIRSNSNELKDHINIEFIYDRIIDGLRFNVGFEEVSFSKDIYHEHDLYSNSVLFYSILQKLITISINHRNLDINNKVQFTVRDLSSSHLIIIIQFTSKGLLPDELNNQLKNNTKHLFNIDVKNSEQLSVHEAVAKLNGSLDIYNKAGAHTVFTLTLPY
ncbi:MAG TPA: PAS domain-containing protein [Bacteroidia bacterium]|nr:PAS domain-containing protein [Bacteroidia bacterium]